MSFVLGEVRNLLKKDKRFSEMAESREDVTYETGITLFDNMVGNTEDGYDMLGLDAGKMLYIVGRAGSGKTTMAQQIATKIAGEFEQGSVVHFDVENSASRSRVRALSGWSLEEFNNKYTHINTGVNSEHFYSMVTAIADFKVENKDKLSYKTGRTNSITGEEEEQLQPTVVILDSLSSLITKEVGDEKEISGGMTASHNAKVNASIFRRLVNTLNRANIVLIIINHITDNIDINPMQRKKAQVNFLSQTESIPGGKVPIFLSDTFIKLDPGRKLKVDQDYGKQGFLVNLQIIKSRRNAAGVNADLVFFPAEGFSNVLSNFEFLVKNKLIGGSGHGYFIEPLPDFKFRRKNLEEVYAEDKEFAKEFDRYCQSVIKDFFVQNFQDDPQAQFESNLEMVEDDLFKHKESGKYYEYDEKENKYYEVELEDEE